MTTVIEEIESNIQDRIAMNTGAYPTLINTMPTRTVADMEGCGLIVVDWNMSQHDANKCKLEYLTMDNRGLVITFAVREQLAPINTASHLEVTLPTNSFETNLKTPIHFRFETEGWGTLTETIAGNALLDMVRLPNTSLNGVNLFGLQESPNKMILMFPKFENAITGIILISQGFQEEAQVLINAPILNEGYPVFSSKKKLKKINGAFSPTKGGLWWAFERKLMNQLTKEHRLSHGRKERNIFLSTPIFVMNKTGIWTASLNENGLIEKVEPLTKQPNRNYVGHSWSTDGRTYAITFGEYAPYYLGLDQLYDGEQAIYEIMVEPVRNSKHLQVRAGMGYTIVKGKRTNMVVRLYDYHDGSSYIVEESAVSRLPKHSLFKGGGYQPIERLERFTDRALLEEDEEMTPEEKKILVRWLFARTVDLARRGDELPNDENSLATKLGLTGE